MCGAGSSTIRDGRPSKASALALAARPDMATTGKAAAATTTPASRPQMSNEAALVSTLRSRLRIQVTGTGYATVDTDRVLGGPRSLSGVHASQGAFSLVTPLSTLWSPAVAGSAQVVGSPVLEPTKSPF